MEPLAQLLTALVPAVWTAAAATYLFVFLRDDAGAVRWSRRLAVAGVLVHAGALAALLGSGHAVLAASGGLLWGMALAVALVYLILEGRIGSRGVGVVPIGLVTLLVVAGAAAGDLFRAPPENLPRASTAVHVVGAMLGYAGLLLAAIFGGLYLAQRHSLRARKFGLVWERLPSLELLDEFSWRSLLAGAVFLTLTIGFGHVVRRGAGLHGPYWDLKIVATNALWLVTAVVALLRWTNRLRPLFSAVATLCLLGLAVGNMLVVDVFSRVHRGF